MGNNEWLDIDVLDDYLEGKLDASTMHKIERISLDDPFVGQALAGLTAAKKRTHTLSLLQQQLQERIEQKPIERKMWRTTSMRLSIAATAAVIFIAVSVLFWLRENDRFKNQELVNNKPKQVEVTLQNSTEAKKTPPMLTPSNEPAIDAKKVENVLATTVNDANGAIAKNKDNENAPIDGVISTPSSQNQLNKKDVEVEEIKVTAKSAAPINPVSILNNKAEGITPKTAKGKLYKNVLLDSYGRPIPGSGQGVVENLRNIPIKPIENNAVIEKEQTTSTSYAKAAEKNNIALSEVVVVNSPIAEISAINKLYVESDNATPKDGWLAYREYLKKNNRLYSDGSKQIVLKFTITVEGKPTEITIVTSLSKTFDEEAIRLIKAGGLWLYQAENKVALVTIKF